MLIRLTTSVPKTLTTWYARVTRSRMTMAFIFFVLAHYVAQATLHAMVLSAFSQDRELVTATIDAAGVRRGFTVVQQGVLEICSGIPTVDGTTCYTVYNGSAVSPHTYTLHMRCAEGLTWLENYLLNSKSEEVVYLVWETWLVVISLVAVIDESIPNLFVVLGAQIVNTSWISYRIVSDVSAKHTYDKVIVDGACGSYDILGGSWQYDLFCVAFGFSILGLLVMSFFVFKLVRLYSEAKLSNVGSPPGVTRMLNWRLWMRVFLQFASFFTLASAAVWYDKRKSVTMASYYSTDTLYDVGFYIVALIILPWSLLGIYSVSKEKRLLFLVYSILSIVLLVISGLWFGSALFRYEYGVWHTFACLTTLADILLVIACVLSVVCRLNFGKGLAHFLVVERELQAAGFACDMFLDGPNGPSRFSVGVKQELTPNRPLSQFTLIGTRSSFQPLRHVPSLCSVSSSMFATWLPSKGGADLENGEPQRATDERPCSIVVNSTEAMRSCATPSISDSDSLNEIEEKQRTVA